MATAFVLISVETGLEREVMEDLKQIPEVKEATCVYGVYDIIARLEAKTMEDIKNAISWGIRRLDRVKSTVTMLVM